MEHPTGHTRRQFVVATAVAGGGAWWLFGRGAPASASATGDAYRGAVGDVTITDFSPSGASTGTVTLAKVMKSDAQWRRQFSPLAYAVLRAFDDERPFTGAHWNRHDAGVYRCVACDTAAFSSAHKFDSGTGWPSFTQPIARANVRLDKKGPAVRVLCARCDSFLGDLFDDGPKPDGWRYCINSVALRFVPANTPRTATAVFAGGCFWGVDAVFKHVRGVRSVTSGYAGGSAATATYDIVSEGESGHAESVRVTYDPAIVSYEVLLKVFFLVAHDPTQRNRQGPDVGSQYRSAVFYADAEQKAAADLAIASLTDARVFARQIVTELAPLDAFFVAEPYHQNYLAEHPTQPYIVYNDLPKLEAVKVEFPEWYRGNASG